jgi:uncharacterized protein (TIGR03435 family)
MRMALVLAALSTAAAQSPTFEVASIKPYQMEMGQRVPRFGCTGGPGTKDPGRWTCVGVTTRMLVVQAYDLKFYQFSGPAHMDQARFSITAKVPEGATQEQFRQMVQNLLAERFRLKTHREYRETAMYDLVVAKGGPKFRGSMAAPVEESAPGAERPRFTMGKNGFPEPPPGMSASMSMGGKYGWRVARQTMAEFAHSLSGFVGKPVMDATGLAGRYDLLLQWLDATGSPVPVSPDAVGPTIFAALQEQLGLRLEGRKGMLEMVVVDSVEKGPTEN